MLILIFQNLFCKKNLIHLNQIKMELKVIFLIKVLFEKNFDLRI